MAQLAVIVEGGLISGDLLARIAASPQEVDGQRPAHFGIEGRLSDEIQSAFSDARSYWEAFQRRLARLKEGERATTLTREAWVNPLLEELGYDLVYQRAAIQAAGNSYLISHRLGDDPAAPPVHIVGWEQPLDRRGELKQSPHAMVQDYLNRSDALWGIVSNGRTLRLLRNTARFSKPSFIEFDLEAILQGNLYSEFVLFYRLIHATRLPKSAGDAPDSWLERYYQQGIEEGGRVRERLRDGVKDALEILGTGLLAHPASEQLRADLDSGRLTDLAYYRQLLRLIYRLLFLMVAEERRLLFVSSSEHASRQQIYSRWYSAERLRKRAESRIEEDHHGDLWEGLKKTFRLFEDEAAAGKLGLTALDGELFGRFACANLIDTDRSRTGLTNDRLLAAIWRLSTFEDSTGRGKRGPRRRVNFAGLDVEELGSVYESLLEYHPEVRIDGERSQFELVGGSERKTTGSYYTPPELVAELIKSALVPVIEERLAAAQTTDEKERTLLALKVCDPASGSGHFVLAAARRLGRELARVRSGETEPNPEDYRHAIRDVIRRCIYAVDKNPLAVDLCKVALWIEGHEPGLPLSFLDHHVRHGDSLVGVLDLGVIEAGVPGDAYKAVTGDDKKVAGEVRKRNRAETKQAGLFRHPVAEDMKRIAGAFEAIADLRETTPEEVQRKEEAYRALRDKPEWRNARWACDLWTAAFFAPLKESGAVPTTRDVWDAVGGRPPQGRIAGVTTDLARAQPFFHWPLEFPEVLTAGGFDAVLGNPPWEVTELNEKQFFASLLPGLAAQSGAARKQSIERLERDNPSVWDSYRTAKRLAEASNAFVRASNRYSRTGSGKVNTYALFAETAYSLRHARGVAGMILPTGIAVDFRSREFLWTLLVDRQLRAFIGFDNKNRIFPAVASDTPFCIFVMGNNPDNVRVTFELVDFATIGDDRRYSSISPNEVLIVNPNTRTLPSVRSQADKELLMKMYEQPVLSADSGQTACEVNFRQGILNMTSDSQLFVSDPELRMRGAEFVVGKHEAIVGTMKFVPLYEPKMVHQFDHRFGTFEGLPNRPPRGSSVPRPNRGQLEDPTYVVRPWHWLLEKDVENRFGDWKMKWVVGWRFSTNPSNERTFIASFFPRSAVPHILPMMTVESDVAVELLVCLVANVNSLCLDFVTRNKMSRQGLDLFIVRQLPVIPTAGYSGREMAFVVPRALELTYTADDMRPFAEDLGYDGPPFRWDPERRAELRAELDAYYAYLYGLTRKELEYILDPKSVMGSDYPSETFRVLQDNEIRRLGEYRTQRLVLDAWDRFAADGTFDPVRLRDPQYIDRIADELATTRGRLEESERNARTLLTFASKSPEPTLFVEGETDAAIIEAAWSVFFPREPLPAKVHAAGGTTEMGSLAGKGKALRELLGDRKVAVLADNDAAGRALIDDGHVRKGGLWRQLPNGIHWCLLKPTQAFAAAMKTHNIPAANWPFTIEAAFAPALRRQALAEGAYRFADRPQAELLANAEVATRLFSTLPKLDPDDDAYFWLMAPHHEAKESFAAWVTAPERLTEDNYGAFEEIIRGLRDLLARRDDPDAARIRGVA